MTTLVLLLAHDEPDTLQTLTDLEILEARAQRARGDVESYTDTVRRSVAGRGLNLQPEDLRGHAAQLQLLHDLAYTAEIEFHAACHTARQRGIIR